MSKKNVEKQAAKTAAATASNLTKKEQMLLDKEIARQLGLVKKGRPSDPNSKSAKRKAELAAKRAAGVLTLGRPKYTPEQQAEANAIKEQKAAEEKERIAKMAAEILANQN